MLDQISLTKEQSSPSRKDRIPQNCLLHLECDRVGLLFVRKWVGEYSFAWDSALLCSAACCAQRRDLHMWG
jgi:hypothetical protein